MCYARRTHLAVDQNKSSTITIREAVYETEETEMRTNEKKEAN